VLVWSLAYRLGSLQGARIGARLANFRRLTAPRRAKKLCLSGRSPIV